MRVPAIITRALNVAKRRRRLTLGVGTGVLALVGVVVWWGVRAAYLRVELPEHRDGAVLLANVPAPKPTRVVTFEEGCTTSRCHGEMTGSAAVHAPVAQGRCEVCHAADAGGHRYPLVRAASMLCTSCHETGLHEKYQHQAMGEDGCVACHNPHGGATRAMLVAGSERETCVRCHAMTRGTVVHKPYAGEGCETCHDPHGAGNARLLLGGEGEAHCVRCHGEVVRKVEGGPHERIEGRCLGCHAGHASEHGRLLVGEIGAVCVGCHPKIGEEVSRAVVSHDPVLKGQRCTTCHDPHGAGNGKMLRSTKAQVCLSCHDKAQQGRDGRMVAAVGAALASAPVVHGAVRLGDCSACHSVHGSEHERLLRAGAANVLLGAYDVKNYALCFSCHDANLAEAGGATAFRDGEVNLHAVHLKSGERSRSCATCHSVHAGDLPRLIAKNVNLDGSTWSMGMGFTLTEEGGRCASACHETLSYSRRDGGAKAERKGGRP